MKGTITVYYDIVKPLMSFNPRTHEGYDHDFFTNEKLPFNSFNPRTREGYDTIDRGVNVSIYHFNPRTHEGYDINQTRLSEIDTILIPVPVKGTIWKQKNAHI